MDVTESTEGEAALPPGADRETAGPVALRSRAAGRAGGIVVAVLAVGALVIGSLALARPAPGRQSSHHRAKVVLASAQASDLQPGATISVTGSGSVQGRPTEVSFTIGISTTSATATGALDENNAQVQSLETTLEHNHVLARQMQTSSLYVSDDTNTSGEITGFSVDDDLNVDMSDVAAAGSAIDAAAQAVGNGIQLDGISFSISNESALLAKARAAAMLNARTEADQVAEGAGLALGPVVRIVDQENAPSQYLYGGAGFATASLPADALTLEAGRQPVSVQVSVVYELRS